jgi:hypothetical protein
MRKSIPKKIRFEVLKRDSFKCQYCGAAAPEVLLHVDHIDPVIEGGSNDIINLITSCSACNLGKGRRLLNDSSAIIKQHAQLEELQLRREQLEMMMEWKRSLRDINEDEITELCQYWQDHALGWTVNQTGKNNLKKWVRQFSIDELTHAMDISAESYLDFNSDGTVTSESWEVAFSKIPGICRVERASKEDPDIKELYYIRGIARNTCQYYFNDSEALDWLKAARSWDVPIVELREIARNAASWTKFKNKIFKAIEYQKDIQGYTDEHK